MLSKTWPVGGKINTERKERFYLWTRERWKCEFKEQFDILGTFLLSSTESDEKVDIITQ